MVLDIHYDCSMGKVPILKVADPHSPLYSTFGYAGWKIPIAPKFQRNLHPEITELAVSGTGRPDKISNLLLRYYNAYITEDEKYTVMMMTASWVGKLDRNKPQEERYFAEAFPVICIGGMLVIKVKRTEQGLRLEPGGSRCAGVLSSWTVFDDGTGVCAFKGMEDKEITFKIADVQSDHTLMEMLQRPNWSNGIFPTDLYYPGIRSTPDRGFPSISEVARQ